jgi:uncharacterized RDD family membrane protein YckC
LVVPWLVVLGAVGVLLRRAEVLPDVPQTWDGRLVAQLLTMLVLTVPVTLWLAWWEASRHATPGKRLLGLRVDVSDDVDEPSPSIRRTALRSALKVALPWELAHAALWQTWDSQATVFAMALIGLVYVVVGIQVVLLFHGGRTLHDRIAHTVVRSA